MGTRGRWKLQSPAGSSAPSERSASSISEWTLVAWGASIRRTSFKTGSGVSATSGRASTYLSHSFSIVMFGALTGDGLFHDGDFHPAIKLAPFIAPIVGDGVILPFACGGDFYVFAEAFAQGLADRCCTPIGELLVV